MFRLLKNMLVCASLMVLVACGQPDTTDVIKVGTIAGPESALMEVARDVMQQKYGITLKIVEFSDYSMPNIALADGSLDANVFQHQLYLDATKQARGYQLQAIGKTFIYPMGIYSKKHLALADLPDQATVAIPNDPSNEARALLLLEKADLIKLDHSDKTHVLVTQKAMIENTKQLKLKLLDGAQLPRALADVDLAVINTNFAIAANLVPSRDALFLEDKDSPYANVIVVREADKDKPALQKLVAALHDAAVLKKAQVLFADQAIPAWIP